MIWGSFACIQLRWQSPFCLAASPSLESNCVSCCHRRAGRSCCCPKTSARLPLQSPLPLSSSPPYRFTFLFSSVSCFMIPPHKLTKSCRRHAIAIFSTTTCCLRLRESLSKLSLFDVIATADTCQCNACASNDTCQCIAAVLVLVVAQPV